MGEDHEERMLVENSRDVLRMASADPGIARPELGRATAHDEALALPTRWIAAMPQSDAEMNRN